MERASRYPLAVGSHKKTEPSVLFKTRASLCVLNKNVEIQVYPPRSSKVWSIAAHYRSGPEGESKSLLGKAVKFGGPWFYLAAFEDDEAVEAEIGQVMQIIANAYENSSPVCDLSQVGSSAAWRELSKNWTAIHWPADR